MSDDQKKQKLPNDVELQQFKEELKADFTFASSIYLLNGIGVILDKINPERPGIGDSYKNGLLEVWSQRVQEKIDQRVNNQEQMNSYPFFRLFGHNDPEQLRKQLEETFQSVLAGLRSGIHPKSPFEKNPTSKKVLH